MTLYTFNNDQAITIPDGTTGVIVILPQVTSIPMSKLPANIQALFKAAGWTSPYQPQAYQWVGGPISAQPYPSIIQVSGLPSPITKVQVHLGDFSDGWASDISILLVGPTGAKAELLSASGGGYPLNHVELTFDPDATQTVPQSTLISSGTYKPTDPYPYQRFLPPAPPAVKSRWGTNFYGYKTDLTTFKGTDGNGEWQLFVMNESEGNTGSIGHWQLIIQTA